MQEPILVSYGKYFRTGVYSARYNDDVSMRAYHTVKRLIYRTVSRLEESQLNTRESKNKVLKLVDYGCGNGRYFEKLKKIAQSLREKSILLDVTGVDPIIEGLSEYKRKLWSHDFVEIDSSLIASGEESARVFAVLENQNCNMRVKLIKNSIGGDLGIEADVIGRNHCAICMFGVLSHIQTRKRRQDTMSMLCSIISGETLYSLPNASRCFTEEQIQFGSRDIYYSRNEEIRLPYHLYTKGEIEDDVLFAQGCIRGEVCSASVFDETMILSNIVVNLVDFVVTEQMPSIFVEYLSKYFLFEVRRYAGNSKIVVQNDDDLLGMKSMSMK